MLVAHFDHTKVGPDPQRAVPFVVSNSVLTRSAEWWLSPFLMIFSLYLSDSTAFSVIIPFLYVLTSNLLVHRLHQACRGTLLDSGTLVSTDSSCGPGDSDTLGSLRRIPIEADLLVAYAVQPALTKRGSTTSLFIAKQFTCYPTHTSEALPQPVQATCALCVCVGLLMRLLVAGRSVKAKRHC
ncbi:Caspase-3 [Taenia solium]|eukprot:TsM_000122200 transcript=TsM_000122200 gene=TsM_000122200